MKIKIIAICFAAISILWHTKPSFAIVDYSEVISAGAAGSTGSTGNSTVLARTLYADSNIKFRARLQYVNLVNVDLRWMTGPAASGNNGTISATLGNILLPGRTLILGLEDMKNFRCCAGTTTAGSYGTVTAIYEVVPADSKRSAFVEVFDPAGYKYP